jgi:hypothetical protein
MIYVKGKKKKIHKYIKTIINNYIKNEEEKGEKKSP